MVIMFEPPALSWSTLLAAVYSFTFLANVSFAQGLCEDVSNIKISFKESDTRPGLNDRDYVRVIIRGRPDSVRISEDSSVSTQQIKFQNIFRLDYNSSLDGYYVQMIGAIDRDGPTARVEDDISILQYRVECQESTNSAINYGILKISIDDVNDNAPRFLNSSVYLTVVEHTPPPSIIYQGVNAVDIDEGSNRIVEYSLDPIPGTMFNGTGLFSIDPQQGDIQIDGQVDFESMYEMAGRDASQVRYQFVIVAVDKGLPAQTSTALLTIQITDQDDQGPTFYYPTCEFRTGRVCPSAEYSSQILSNDTDGSTLNILPVPQGQAGQEVDILAHDRDTLNASLECIIRKASPESLLSYFKVNTSRVGNTREYQCIVIHLPGKPISAVLYPAVDLLLEVKEQNFQARSASAKLYIDVLENPNDNQTLFPSSTLDPTWNHVIISPAEATGYVFENSAVGSVVYGDMSLMTELEFDFSVGNMDGSGSSDPDIAFIIDQSPPSPFTVTQDGYVEVSEVLDFEMQQFYTFTVTVTDLQTSWTTATADVTIFVLDVNDYSPIFDRRTSYEVSLEEGDYSSSGKSIFTFTATDADGSAENNRVTYLLLFVNPANGMQKFRVGSGGGVVVDGDVSAGDSYNVSVIAIDNGLPSLSSSPAILIVNVIEPATASDDGLGMGVLVGIAVAGVAVVALAIILIAWCLHKRRQERGDNRNNKQDARNAKERNHELRKVAATNPVHYPQDQGYAYADGFIHAFPKTSQNATSGYDNLGSQQDDEEIYDRIDDSEGGDGDDTVTRPSDVPENSYEQLADVIPVDDAPYLTPALPKRPQSREYHPHPEASDTVGARGSISNYSYVQPDEINGNSGNAPERHEYLQPTTSGTYMGIDPNDETEATEGTEGRDQRNESRQNPKGEETGRSQTTAANENDSTHDYDKLSPVDPNYTNLNPDKREYFKVNKLEQKTSL